MTINQKLQDNLIACTELNPMLVPALQDGVTKGPFQSALNLSQIADAVKVSNLAPAAPGTNTSHARPTMLSGISGFVENVKTAIAALAPGGAGAAALTTTQKQDFAEWQGMIAAVALTNVYCGMGLNLSVKEMNIDANGNAAMACVLREMEKDSQYRAAVNVPNNTGTLYYICQNGEPFAVFHPEICLCPMRQYSRELFAGVLSWYDETSEDCHAAWKDVLALDEFCLSRIAWWAGNNNLLSYLNYINNQKPGLPILAAALVNTSSIPTANCINNVPAWGGKGSTFGTAMMAYLDAAGIAHPLPDVFLDTMLITYTGGANKNKLVYNTAAASPVICFTDGNGNPQLDQYAPVPPFKRTIMNILDHIPLTSLTFQVKLDALGRLESVEVTLTINGLKLNHVYGQNKLRLGQVPYLMLWPFVPMPNGMNLWNSYYATWRSQGQGLTTLLGSNGDDIPLVIGNMNYTWDAQGTVHKSFTPAAPNDQWPVCIGNNPFRYAVLTSETHIAGVVNVEELGLVFMPSYPVYSPAMANTVGANPVKLAIDFGTTSTVCALNHPLLGGGTITLPFQDYSCCVTCDDDTAKENVNIQSWLGNTGSGPAWQWNKKLLSVAQLFEPGINHSSLPAAANQKYYADGRLLMGDALMHLNLSVSENPLEDYQIMTDMKFNHALNVPNYQAASLYLAGVYIYAVLYLLNMQIIPTAGMPFLDVRASYPNDVTLNALQQNWSFAQTILNKMMNPSLTNPLGAITYYNEATAATAFHAGNPAFATGLVSMDIGGGTTDISISNSTLHPNDVRNLSVRYAGREIMVSSLLEFYRKINTAVPAVVDGNSFNALWGANCNGQANLFRNLCAMNHDGTPTGLHGLNKNDTLRMMVEMLLNQGMNLGASAPMSPTTLPRQLITMKFFMLLDLVAKAVEQNLDIWKNPKTGDLALVGGKLQINLSVSGTGAQLLQYVFDCTMPNLVILQTPAAIPAGAKMAQCLDLMNQVFTDALAAHGVATDLRIYVNPNVADKQDVSYGMMNPGIAMLAPPAAPVPMPAGVRAEKTAAMQTRISLYDGADLDAYISRLMSYWGQYENIYNPAPAAFNRGLGSGIKAMSDLMTPNLYNNYFTAAVAEVSQTRAAYMIEPEQQPYLDQLKGMYMVEELLDWLIAQHQ